VLVGILGATLLNTIYISYSYRKNLWSTIKTFTIYRNKEIRFSIAYLYKIKIDSKYFLIKSKRIDNLYQPVGGVYKRLPESVKIFSELKILDDNCLPIDKDSESDLRIRVSGRNVKKFIDWYKSEQDREICHWREFCEELLKSRILNPSDFPHIQYRKIRQEKEILIWSDYHQCYEYKIFDIIEPIFTEVQKKVFEKLIDIKDEKYEWVDESLIKSLGHDNNKKTSSFRIGNQTNYII